MMRRDETYIQRMTDYLKRNVKKGYTLETLRWALINQGHSKLEVEKAMGMVHNELVKEAPVLKQEMPKIEPVNVQVEDRPWWKRWFG